MTWRILPDKGDGRFAIANSETGEIREWPHGFDAMVRAYDEYGRILGKVAAALGPDVLKAWEDS